MLSRYGRGLYGERLSRTYARDGKDSRIAQIRRMELKNAMVRTLLPVYSALLLIVATFGCDAKQQPLEAKVTEKKQPLLVQISDDDLEMGGAIAEARRTVDRFIAALKNPRPNQKAFSVKVAVQDREETEHLWLVPVRYENGSFVGRVDNEPQYVKTVRFGDEITVAKDQISDWIYAEDGKMMGGYTARVLSSSSDAQKNSGKARTDWQLVRCFPRPGSRTKPQAWFSL